MNWIYKYGLSDVKIGSRGLSTALALNAIAVLHTPQPHEELELELEIYLTKERSYTVEIMTAPVALP